MATPKYTADGVKVQSNGNDHYCGHCGAFLRNSYGFPSEGVICSKCHIKVRPDWSPNTPSERLNFCILKMWDIPNIADSRRMTHILCELESVLEEMTQNENHLREMWIGAGFRQSIPVDPETLIVHSQGTLEDEPISDEIVLTTKTKLD